MKKGKGKDKAKNLEQKSQKDKVKENKLEEEEDDKEDLSSEQKSQKEDLYALLGLKKSATKDEIRKAYKRLVFLCHPDKNKDDPSASEKFRNISKAYKILSDDNSRKIYDETGDYDEEQVGGGIDIPDTLNYFRKIYSTNIIEEFMTKYINSKEEEEDLINFYKDNNGDIKKLLETIPCSRNQDINRFLDIYESLFKRKILKKNKNYEATKSKIHLLKEDKQEEEEAKKELEKLTQQIMLNKKKRNFNDYLDGLTEKYVKKFKNDEDGEDFEEEQNKEISEEEFQKIANKLNGNKKKKNKRK